MKCTTSYRNCCNQQEFLDLEYVKKLRDGHICRGRQVFDVKLIDVIGNKDTALKWLQEKKAISKDLDLVNVKLNCKRSVD